MSELIESICAIEQALHGLEVLTDKSLEPHLATELQRLETRLLHLHNLIPVFAQPV